MVKSLGFECNEKNHSCDVCSANTEDSLISSSDSAETVSSISERKSTMIWSTWLRKKNRENGPSWTLTIALLLLIFGTAAVIWTPFDVFMNERLRMMPGLPAFNWWKNPPDTVILNVYIFNITNAEEFLSGKDAKLRVEQVGPIVFSELWAHQDVVFNDNSTISYTVNHTAVYRPELNTLSLNATLVVPNMAVLGTVSYMWDASFFTKVPLNYLLRSLNSSPIRTATLYEYLYDSKDPLFDMANSLLPSLVPTKNYGIMRITYDHFVDRVTAYMGSKFGHQMFSLIDRYAGSTSIPGHGDSCKDDIRNASEGVIYNQFVARNASLRYYRKTLCRVVPLSFERDVRKYGLDAYKFTLPNNSYDRTEPQTDDCHKSVPRLTDGLSDMSKCFFNFPIAASFPHYLYGDPKLSTYVDGLEPNVTRHGSYVFIEPTTGIPLESRARTQCNLIVRPLRGFNSVFDKFSNTVLPMFWLEYAMAGLPYYVVWLTYFTVNVLPPLQWVMTSLSLFFGFYLTWTSLRKIARRRYEINRNKFLDKKVPPFEQQLFISK